MATEAGWYDDGTGVQRWWDGTRWTEHYIDLHDRDPELRSDAVPTAPTAAGWYDDGRGRQRWWDGIRWTESTRFSGQERAFAGIVVDGRWIHFGARSHPVAGAAASFANGAELLKRGRLTAPAVARVLFAASGQITPRLLKRAVPPTAQFILVEMPDQVWLATVPPGRDAGAGPFAGWINTVSEHYRYG